MHGRQTELVLSAINQLKEEYYGRRELKLSMEQFLASILMPPIINICVYQKANSIT